MTNAEAQRLFDEGNATIPEWDAPDGPATKKKMEKALALLAKAFDLGHLVAGERLGGLLQYRDMKACFAVLVRLAKLGSEDELAALLREDDLPDALAREVVAAAEAGQPWAATTLAVVFLNVAGGNAVPEGRGLDAKKPREAMVQWLERAAAKGWPPAQWRLALALKKSDPARALVLARDAARDVPGSASCRPHAAQLWLSLVDEVGAAGSVAEAVGPTTYLAGTGHVPSMVWLGEHLLTGEGMARDVAAARAWFERAVQKGSADAHRELGKMDEAAGDDDRAREHYESAAEIEGDDYSRERLAKKWGLTEYAKLDKMAVVRSKKKATKAAPKKAAKPPKKTAKKTPKTPKKTPKKKAKPR